MPITGTSTGCGPTNAPCQVAAGSTPLPVALADCQGLNTLTPRSSYVNGRAVLTRMRNVTVRQGQCACIHWVFYTPDGTDVDFTDCVSSDSSSSSSSSSSDTCATGTMAFKLRITEALNSQDYEEITGTLLEDNKTVEFCLTEEQTGCPGIFFAVAAIMDCSTGAECLYYANTFYLTIDPGLHGIGVFGAPTIAEVRLALRDSGPAESSLLNNLAFSDEEIALAIIRPVQLWNELPPDIRRYTTTDFPFRYHWLEAIAGQLFLMAAEYNRRNNLNYSAANVAVNDLDKEPQYEAAGQRRMEQYRQFVRAKKVEMNVCAGFGGF